MYKMFCSSFMNYMKMNNYNNNDNSFRNRMTNPIKVLADIDLYREYKNEGYDIIHEVANLVYIITEKQHIYQNFKAFSWELDGYGFEKSYSNKYDLAMINEQCKLIDLLLSCHFWGAA